MTATAHEKYKGLTVKPDGVEQQWYVDGTDDPSAALSAVLTASPTTTLGFIRRPPTIRERGPKHWLATVPYSRFEPDNPDDPEPIETDYSFSVSTETLRLRQSFETVAKYPAGSAPDFQQQIGVKQTPQGHDIEGVDVKTPVASFSYTLRASTGFVTAAYQLAVEAKVGTVCSHSFKGRPAGEVLLLGISGRVQTGTTYDWELTFDFLRSPNAINFSIGDLTGISKRGWDYLWTHHELVEDAGAKILKPKPSAVYIERVYPFTDWQALGPWAVR